MLAATPSRLADLTEGLPPAQLLAPPKPGEWSAQEFQPSLQAFTAQRAELLVVLKPLAPEAWSRMATVTGAGKPHERTVYAYAQWLANHERPHIKQIERIVNTVRV
jgi:hypothetical protein